MDPSNETAQRGPALPGVPDAAYPARRTPSRRLRIAGALVAVAAIALLAWGLLRPAHIGAPPADVSATPAPLVGHPAPDMTLLDLRNNHVSLSSLRGKVVVLNFWYVACPPCKLEMPALEQAYRADQGRGLVVVGVNVSDDARTISDYLTQLGISYPVWRDVGQRATVQYRLTDTPTSFFVDRQGIIRYKVVGPLDSATLTRDAGALLTGG